VDPRESGRGDLFEPSLQAEVPAHARAERRPWRFAHQFFVAILGGPLAMGAIAYLNAGRLGLGGRARGAILAAALAAGAAVLAAAVWIATSEGDATAARRNIRLLSRVGGVAVYGLAYLSQRSADRIHQMRTPHEQPYDALWIPGALASFGGGFALALATQLLIAATSAEAAE
jgi:hypothetical protein